MLVQYRNIVHNIVQQIPYNVVEPTYHTILKYKQQSTLNVFDKKRPDNDKICMF